MYWIIVTVIKIFKKLHFFLILGYRHPWSQGMKHEWKKRNMKKYMKKFLIVKGGKWWNNSRVFDDNAISLASGYHTKFIWLRLKSGSYVTLEAVRLPFRKFDLEFLYKTRHVQEDFHVCQSLTGAAAFTCESKYTYKLLKQK